MVDIPALPKYPSPIPVKIGNKMTPKENTRYEKLLLEHFASGSRLVAAQKMYFIRAHKNPHDKKLNAYCEDAINSLSDMYDALYRLKIFKRKMKHKYDI